MWHVYMFKGTQKTPGELGITCRSFNSKRLVRKKKTK